MIPRPRAMERVQQALAVHPVAALLGPRQCGKTTLARAIAETQPSTTFDLEHPVDARALQAPLQALGDLQGLIVVDEVQRQPELLDLVRVLVDRPSNRARFLLLGSAAPGLVRGVSESLAGRVGFIDLSGFDIQETGVEHSDALWLRGGFPRSYLANDVLTSLRWRDDFVRTFLERDLPQLGITVPAETLRRFWTMIAHYHGQVWNAAEFARSIGSAERTARRYLDLLAGAYVVRVLPPWFQNLKKRQVRSPKVYVRDSGLLHALLQIGDATNLRSHPELGASWEGFGVEQVITLLETRDAYFWATHAGAELDLLVRHGGKHYGFEFKYSDAPGLSRPMHVAMADLALEHLWVVYPGAASYSLAEAITAVPMSAVPRIVAEIR